MDILSHALWANLVFKELPVEQRSLTVVFGVMPDFVSFLKVFGKDFIRKTMHYTDPPLKNFPKIVFTIYNITHSLVIWLGVFLILKIFSFDYAALAFCGWGLHILLDIFTHTKSFFQTPILFPFSNSFSNCLTPFLIAPGTIRQSSLIIQTYFPWAHLNPRFIKYPQERRTIS
mgnify:CR=1 FL=1